MEDLKKHVKGVERAYLSDTTEDTVCECMFSVFSSSTTEPMNIDFTPKESDDDHAMASITTGMQVMGSTNSFLFNCFENTYPGEDGMSLKNLLLSKSCLGAGMKDQLLSSHQLIRHRKELMHVLQHASHTEDVMTVRMRSGFESIYHAGVLGTEMLRPAASSARPSGQCPQGSFVVKANGSVERAGELPDRKCCRDSRSLSFQVTAFNLEDAETCQAFGVDTIKDFIVHVMTGRDEINTTAFQVQMSNGTVCDEDNSWRLMMNAYIIFQREQFLLIRDCMDLKFVDDVPGKRSYCWDINMSVHSMQYVRANEMHASSIIRKICSEEGASWERVRASATGDFLSKIPSSGDEAVMIVKEMCKAGRLGFPGGEVD